MGLENIQISMEEPGSEKEGTNLNEKISAEVNLAKDEEAMRKVEKENIIRDLNQSKENLPDID